MNDLGKYRPGGGVARSNLAPGPEVAPGLAALVAESRQVKAELAPLSDASRTHGQTLPALIALADERGAALEADLAEFTRERAQLADLAHQVKSEKEELASLTEASQQTRRQLLQEVSAQIEAAAGPLLMLRREREELARLTERTEAQATRLSAATRASREAHQALVSAARRAVEQQQWLASFQTAAAPLPGAIQSPPSGRNSGGPTDFAFLYSQLGSLDTRLDRIDNGLTSGPMAIGLQDLANVNIFSPTNGQVLTYDTASGTWKNLAAAAGASLSGTNTFTAVNSFCVDDAGQNTITDTLNLCHTYNAGFGTVGQGVGLNFQTETNAALETIAQIEADTLAAGGSNVTKGRLNFRLVTTGASIVTPLQLYTQQVSIPQAPISSAVRALLQLGSGPFTFGGSPPAGTFNSISTGTVLGINEVSGFTGNLLDAQINGLSRFRISSTADHRAQVYDTTNAAVTALSVVHRFTTGNPTAGFGVALDFVGDNSIGSLATYAEINASATSVSAGSEQADLVFLCHSAERLRIVGATQDVNTSGQYQAVGGMCAGSTTTKNAVVDIRRSGTSNPAAAALTSLQVVGPADTGLTAGVECTDVYLNLFSTKTFGSVAPSSLQRVVRIEPPIFSAGSAQTINQAATLYIGNAPTAGANITLTNRYSIWCAGGAAKFEGDGVTGVVFELAGDSTAPTGAASGRVKVNIPGIGIRYIGTWAS